MTTYRQTCRQATRRRGTSTSVGGEMAMWLKSDLEMTNADWLIAFWHHPPYSNGSVDADRLALLQGVGDAVHRPDNAVARVEIGLEIGDF